MRGYTLSHLSDHELLRDLAALFAQDHTTTAALLAHLSEVDARRLYLPAGYPSMYAYCVHEWRLSEDAAYKRIQAARAARQFPAIFTAVADGRLHLTAVGLLAPHLTRENADELLAAAAHKTKAEIEELLAQRFPRPELLALVQPLPRTRSRSDDQLAPAQVGSQARERDGALSDQPASAHVKGVTPRSSVEPHAPGRVAIHLTMRQATYHKLQYAQALLSHAMPSGEVAEVFDRALDELIPKLEKRKFAATDRPRTGPRRSAVSKRCIPARVKRAVWERDQGQCTFVGETGHRCPARRFLEFDHADPVARGGQATVERMRLRCRAHNQYEAERMFGAGFMNDKREEARRAAAARARAAEAEAHARNAAEQQAQDVRACLRGLGFRADEVRRAAEFSETLHNATLEERVRAALKCLGPKTRFHVRVGTTVGVPS